MVKQTFFSWTNFLLFNFFLQIFHIFLIVKKFLITRQIYMKIILCEKAQLPFFSYSVWLFITLKVKCLIFNIWQNPFNSHRPKSCASSLSAGHEGQFSWKHPDQAPTSPTSEPHPVCSTAPEHTRSTRDSTATPELPGETETVPATGPHQQGTTIKPTNRIIPTQPQSLLFWL